MTEDNIDDESLRTLQRLTANLPREIEPPADAWSAIQDAIYSEQKDRSPSRSSRFWQRPAFLAAAALLLVAGSSLVTSLVINRNSQRTLARQLESGRVARDARPADVTSSAPATLAEFTAKENDYISTANRLSAVLDSSQVQLSPETVSKLKQSIRTIDAAILEARRALAADPANRQLMEMLSNSYDQKVDLLRRTTEMARS
jgi:hypothetical protein